jgi:hypothetical protein
MLLIRSLSNKGDGHYFANKGHSHYPIREMAIMLLIRDMVSIQ